MYLTPEEIRAVVTQNSRKQDRDGTGLPISYQEVNEAVSLAASDHTAKAIVAWLRQQNTYTPSGHLDGCACTLARELEAWIASQGEK